MIAVQHHGFQFEQWVRDTFFEGYAGIAGQKWDIPAAENASDRVPAEFRGLAVSVKTAKYGAPVALGDALRQLEIDEPFVLIVGFWRQRLPAEKWIEDIAAVKFSPADWAALWQGIDHDSLRAIDARIKDLSLPYRQARSEAKAWKKTLSAGGISINPKIDSKRQRRIQCSIPFKALWECARREPTRGDNPTLFGAPFPNPIASKPREFIARLIALVFG